MPKYIISRAYVTRFFWKVEAGDAQLALDLLDAEDTSILVAREELIGPVSEMMRGEEIFDQAMVVV